MLPHASSCSPSTRARSPKASDDLLFPRPEVGLRNRRSQVRILSGALPLAGRMPCKGRVASGGCPCANRPTTAEVGA
jgi:hypothetical protein